MHLTKDVEIAGVRYQIGRFKARDGSWILATILTKMLPSSVESALAADGARLGANRAQLSEAEFASLQGHALAVCRRYENGVPMPVFVLPNTFAVKELEYDLGAVVRLTVEALLFNLSDFFGGDGFQTMLAGLPSQADPNPSNIPA